MQFKCKLIVHSYIAAGPPENVRDYVMAATKALTTGQWERAYNFLTSLSVWPLVGAHKDEVLDMLKTKVQQCGLQTYLFAYGNYYSRYAVHPSQAA